MQLVSRRLEVVCVEALGPGGQKLKYHNPLSSFASSFIVRPYKVVKLAHAGITIPGQVETVAGQGMPAGAHTRPLLRPTLAVLVSESFCVQFVTSYDPYYI